MTSDSPPSPHAPSEASRPRALITGAGIRMGSAIAETLAQAGYDLILHANRTFDTLPTLATRLAQHGARVWLEPADFLDETAVDGLIARLLATHSRLDALVHNAGLFERAPFETIDRRAFRRMLTVNLEVPFLLTRGLLPLLMAAPAPAVVFVSDICGERPNPAYAHYSVSKAGLDMLTRALAVELAPHVRVNAVAPGFIGLSDDTPPEVRARYLARVPLTREGTFEEVARTVRFLLQDGAYITGQVLAIDGGRSARR